MTLSVELSEDLFMSNCGAIAAACIGLIGAVYLSSGSSLRLTPLIQAAVVLGACWLVNDTSADFRERKPLSPFNQYASWTIFVLSQAFPFLVGFQANRNFVDRLLLIFLTFVPPLVLLGISYEVLFFCCFGVNLYLWLLLEKSLYENNSPFNSKDGYVLAEQHTSSHLVQYRRLRGDDVRIAILFLFYINVAFFGTGNVASLASFQLSSVYRLTTVFAPYFMGFLLVFKILIPFIMLSAVFGILSLSLDLPPFSLFLFTVATTDLTTLNFFFLVRDDGSWLEIGTSISHFVIASVFEVLSVLLFGLSWIFVNEVYVPRISNLKKLERRKRK